MSALISHFLRLRLHVPTIWYNTIGTTHYPDEGKQDSGGPPKSRVQTESAFSISIAISDFLHTY